MDIINVRSDTQTLPTPAMRQAVFAAELGDAVRRIDAIDALAAARRSGVGV